MIELEIVLISIDRNSYDEPQPILQPSTEVEERESVANTAASCKTCAFGSSPSAPELISREWSAGTLIWNAGSWMCLSSQGVVIVRHKRSFRIASIRLPLMPFESRTKKGMLSGG